MLELGDGAVADLEICPLDCSWFIDTADRLQGMANRFIPHDPIARAESLRKWHAAHPDYVKNWRASRLAEARQFLGGVCVECGTDEDLQFDHIDPTTKVSEISTLAQGQTMRFWTEVIKCQLLCVEHHLVKTLSERSGPAHGSNRRYRAPYRCRCDICIAGAKRRNLRTVARRQVVRELRQQQEDHLDIPERLAVGVGRPE